MMPDQVCCYFSVLYEKGKPVSGKIPCPGPAYLQTRSTKKRWSMTLCYDHAEKTLTHGQVKRAHILDRREKGRSD